MKKPAFLLTALILIFSASAYAQEAELDLDALVKSALEKNPKIKSLEDAARASKFRIRPAGALPDPVIGLGLKNMGLTRWTVGEEVMSEVGVSVSQMIPFPGKLSLKSQIASTQALQAEEDLKAAKLGLVRQIKELYARLFYYQRSIGLLVQKKEVLEKALNLAEVRYSVGTGVQPDIFRAKVAFLSNRLNESVQTLNDRLVNRLQTSRLVRGVSDPRHDIFAVNNLGVHDRFGGDQLPGVKVT